MSLQNQTPVPILQNEWEFYQLLEEYKQLKPKAILEIGSFFGGTLWHWLMNADELKTVTSIDLPITESDGRFAQMKECRERWHGWTKHTWSTPLLVDLAIDSTHPLAIENAFMANPNGVDFLFIDGDHSYEGVKADYENYYKLVNPGGMIVFHDIVGYWTVKKFWDEVKVGKKYKEICNSGPDGWGIGCLYV